MKITFSTLFLFFFIFADCNIFAGQSTITASYPARSGSYNKVVLKNHSALQAPPNCGLTNSAGIYVNAGLLYMDNTSNTLQMCTSVGTSKIVPYPETCFNIFRSITQPTALPSPPLSSTFLFPHCPSGYQLGNPANIDVFQTATDGTYNYYTASNTCCNNNATVAP
ncbi:MAG: hypothetical protein HQL12_09070 [Candidatus Omnitrophica bacterium]|nr:hypothetical protein [Candidatus Omnitrophota bacterium]